MFDFNLFKKIKKKIFPFYKNRDLKFVFRKLRENSSSQSKTAMFVGGCVRKYLSNEEIDDIDVATTVTVDQIKIKFKETKFKVIDSGIKHGTVTLISENFKLEVTTLRKDITTDGRHAEVEYTDDWEEDSKRRDFTINAIYLDINGKIFDPQSGIDDLNNSRIKFIGDPQKRIEEDYLRIIRFLRFSLEYKSEVNNSTIEAIKLNLNGIKRISKERILIELFKIFNTKNFIKLNEKKLLKEVFSLIFPELKYLERLDKLSKIHKRYNFEATTLLAILLIDNTNNHEYFAHKYNISNKLKNDLKLLAKNYENFNQNKNFFQSDLKKNIFYFGKYHMRQLNILKFLLSNKIKLSDYFHTSNIIDKISLPRFPFDGNYLKNQGIKEGKILGKTLKLLEDEWIANDFKIPDQKLSKIINSLK